MKSENHPVKYVVEQERRLKKNVAQVLQQRQEVMNHWFHIKQMII